MRILNVARLSNVAALVGLMIVTTLAGGCASQQADDLPDLGSVTLLAFRHAEASSAFGADPDLTPEGETRAEAYADALQYAGVTAIYASPFQRTQQTVQPLADRLGLPIHTYDLNGRDLEESLKALITSIQAESEGGCVVVAGHSNTTPMLVRLVTGQELPDLDESEYGDVFIILPRPADGGSAGLVRAHVGRE